jgi:hypothetical protein
MNGKVFATCRHEIPDVEGFSVEETSQTREGKDCLSYPTLCGQCFKEHIKWGIVKRFMINGKWYVVKEVSKT